MDARQGDDKGRAQPEKRAARNFPQAYYNRNNGERSIKSLSSRAVFLVWRPWQPQRALALPGACR